MRNRIFLQLGCQSEIQWENVMRTVERAFKQFFYVRVLE